MRFFWRFPVAQFTKLAYLVHLMTRQNTIQDFVTQNRSGIMKGLLVGAGVLLTGALAQLAVPIGLVPVSGQTLGILIVAAVLGPQLGTWSATLYVAAGSAGLPVFAGGRAGLAVLLGPTGGYLLGFIAASYVVGTLCRMGADRRIWTTFLTMIAGSVVIYLCGVAWLSRFAGWGNVLPAGVYPFVLGDLLKAVVASLAIPLAWKHINRS